MAYTRYYRDITVQNNESEDLIDYQVCIEISDIDFFIKADPNNLVIVDGDTILPYWVETWKRPDGVARIWTKVNLLASGSKTIKLCYGGYIDWINQNGDDIFEFFDDFDSDTLDANKWIWASNEDATYTCNNSILTIHLAPTSEPNYYTWLKCSNSLQQAVNLLIATKITHFFAPDSENTGIELDASYEKNAGGNLFMYNAVISNNIYRSHGYINDEWILPMNSHSRMSSEPLLVTKDINKVLKAHYRDSYYDNLDNTEYNSYSYSEDYEDRRVQIGLYHPKTDSDATAKIDWIYVTKLTNNPPSISISPETEETYYWPQLPTNILSGQVCDGNGNILVNVPVDVIVLNKDTKEVENVTTSNTTDGSWQVEVSSGKKLVIFASENAYGEDINIDMVGAEYLTTE